MEGDKELDPTQVSEQSIIFSHEEIFLFVCKAIFRTAFLTPHPLETNRTLISVHCLLMETMQSWFWKWPEYAKVTFGILGDKY